jgi:DNA ligase-1
LDDLKFDGLSRDYVFDGEIMGSTEFNEDSGQIRRKDSGPNKSLKYHVFDCIRRSEWALKKTRPLCDRMADLMGAFHTLSASGNIVLVDWHDMHTGVTFAEIESRRDEFIRRGFEGGMLKDKRSPYVFKRSDALLKFKQFLDADGRVVAVKEGKKRHKGRLGAITVEFDGVTTDVGSGFTDAQRDELWKNRPIGRVAQVKYQNKSKDGVLRFPVFMKFRPDKE